MERSRGPLGALGNILAGGGQALIGQAQSLADDVQRRIADVVPPVLSGELERLQRADAWRWRRCSPTAGARSSDRSARSP